MPSRTVRTRAAKTDALPLVVRKSIAELRAHCVDDGKRLFKGFRKDIEQMDIVDMAYEFRQVIKKKEQARLYNLTHNFGKWNPATQAMAKAMLKKILKCMSQDVGDGSEGEQGDVDDLVAVVINSVDGHEDDHNSGDVISSGAGVAPTA
jgi:hypothetical protein